MSRLRPLAVPVAVLSVLLGLVILFRPVPFGIAFRLWLVAVGALTAAALLRAMVAPYDRLIVEPVRLWRDRRAPAPRPAGLEEVERAVDFAGWNAADLRNRLRPLLREVAAQRLRAHAGVALDRNPEAARRLLGQEGWQLVSPEFEAPDAGDAALTAALVRLEAL